MEDAAEDALDFGDGVDLDLGDGVDLADGAAETTNSALAVTDVAVLGAGAGIAGMAVYKGAQALRAKSTQPLQAGHTATIELKLSVSLRNCFLPFLVFSPRCIFLPKRVLVCL